MNYLLEMGILEEVMIDGSMQRDDPKELWLLTELYQRALGLNFVNMLSCF